MYGKLTYTLFFMVVFCWKYKFFRLESLMM